MKKYFKIFVLIFASIFTRFASSAQSLDSALSKYAQNYETEKAYLHYDKSFYSAGETIWYKVYLMQALLPAVNSKTFYVDWIADNGTVLYHSVSPLVDGVTNGQFEIPENYSGNFIHVRAYTKWMLNFDTAFLYNKDIRILTKSISKAKNPAVIPSLQFFPEGGDAVAGVANRIAFKANDQYGRPVKIKGIVQDSKGTTIDSLRIEHDGMGSIHMIPQATLTYVAKWKDEKGTAYTTELPAIKPTGISLQVTLSGTKRKLAIQSGIDLPPNLQTLHLLGTMNGKLAFKTDVAIKPGSSTGRIIPTESLPSGILTITVFDAEWNAVAERISFVNNNEYGFESSMEVKHWGLSKRKRNEIEISVPDSLGASLSISVTDAAIERDSSENIISHFLLTSDIKGRVFNPAYYFSSNTERVAADLDLVMLTHGWRRFKWEDITKGKLPPIVYARDSTYLTLSGKVFGVTKSQLTGKESIALIVKERDSSSRMLIVPIRPDGSFADAGVVFFDTVKVYYSLKSKLLGQAEARFMTERLPAPNYVSFSKNFVTNNPFYDTAGTGRHIDLASELVRLRQIDRGKIMETVTVTAKQKTGVQALDDKYASGMFKSGDGYQFDLVNDPLSGSYQNILSYLQGKVAGLQISTGGGGASLSWRGGAPQVYLDEMPVDLDMVMNIPVTDVAYLKVFRPPFLGGFNGANGAIVIYTRKGGDVQNNSRGLTSNTVVAYSPIKEFYSPNYDRFDPRNEKEDIRTTLYWNPLVSINGKTNKLVLSFYNNDVTKTFRVVIEGMTKEGLLTHHEEVME